MISLEELEGRLIYAVIVAGKSADFADAACKRLWESVPAFMSPKQYAIYLLEKDGIRDWVMGAKTGNYCKIIKFFEDWLKSGVNLRTCTPDDLESLHGVGPKTSRFFVTWTRPEARYAVLDRHILRWLDQFYHDVPKNTPNGKTYLKWETVFLEEAMNRHLQPRELDYQIWSAGAGRDQFDSKLEETRAG